MSDSSSVPPRNPLVSVVVPTFRPNPEFFRLAVESVLAQSFRDLELIIVEDPSDVQGREIIEGLRDSRLRHILNETRTSLPQQHNRGLAEARGEFICRFDADDVCEAERIERQLAFLESRPDCDVVGSCISIIDERGTTVGFRRYPLDHDTIIRTMPRWNPIANSSVMFRRRVYERFGGWRTNSPLPAQDYEWYSRLAKGGVRFANLAEYLVRYRIHTGSIKTTMLRDTLRSTLATKKQYWLPDMSFGDRATMVAERALLLLPPHLVLRAFRLLRYRARPA